MNELAPLIFALTFPIVAILLNGRRRRDPAWVMGGLIAGYALLAIGLVWAAGFGREALLAAMLTSGGAATMIQVEALSGRQRSR